MGKRILIPGLIALLLVAGVGAWLVLNPPGQNSDSGNALSPALSNVEGGVSGGTPDATAHRRDADATSVHTGAKPGSSGDGLGTKDEKDPAGGSGASAVGPDTDDSGDDPPDGPLEPNPRYNGPDGPVPAKSFPTHIIDVPRPPNQTLGNARPASRSIHEGRPSMLLSDVSEKLKQDRRGLYAQYYAFTSDPLAELSKPEAKTLAQRDAALVRIDNQVYFPNNEAFSDLPFSLQNFAATWDGYFVVPEQGEYWLFLGADNAARVDLDGETVLLNDVQSRYIEVSTVLELAPGLHPIHIEFEQGMLANEDSWRCACNFMYVPKGQQKPIAVPPEMLMVPDWMWSDDAPIITKLSKNEGEIGDEITIYGQGLFTDSEIVGQPQFQSTGVFFNGQTVSNISVLTENGHGEKSPAWGLSVKVPIGASSGKLTVLRRLIILGFGNNIDRWIPSNSVDFKVTTQFGLMAQWYQLQSGANDFVQPGSPDAIVSRIEPCPNIEFTSDFGVPFTGKPVDCHWEGRLGLPAASQPEDTVDAFDQCRYLRVLVIGHIRVRLGADEKSFRPSDQAYGELGELLFPVDWGEESFLPLSIDFLCTEGICELRIQFVTHATMGSVEGVRSSAGYFKDIQAAPTRLLFPPVAPPKPPRVASVIPIALLGDDPPPTPPFSATPGLISVREGQQFKCNVEIFGDEDVRAAPVTLSVDGHAIECGTGTLIDDSANKRWFRQFVAVLPPGCGEGKLTAKLGLSTSEPFYIDVSNKGLIAYLYDLPNAGGYAQFPNILPLTLHTIRKDRDINFDTADSFKLPFVAETFAVEWYGAIIIENDGWYTFTSRTDDGCRVWLNGIEIINDDNLHAPQEKSSERIKLAPGTYPFRMQFFECNQHEECLLFVAATDLQEKELLAKQVVPKRMFTWEVHDMLPDKIATGKKADGSD